MYQKKHTQLHTQLIQHNQNQLLLGKKIVYIAFTKNIPRKQVFFIMKLFAETKKSCRKTD